MRGTAGSALAAPLVVSVVDAAGRGIRNAEVSWSVSSGGGTLESPSARTDSLGQAHNRWTFGPMPGVQSVTATLAGMQPVVFTATVEPPTPAKAEAVSGGGQSGAVASQLGDSLVVRVTTASGTPAPGLLVSWRFVAGSGAIGTASSTTSADGVVKGAWTLGTAAGEQVVEAIVAGLESAPVSFRALARAGSPARMEKVSGDAQSALVGGRLAEPVVARVTDALGNGVPGASVTWSVALGGGSISPAISVTDSAGRASASWTLGGNPGANQVSAAGAGQTQTFVATGVRPKLPAASVVAAAGGDQRGAAGFELAEPLVARVLDREGSPVEGAVVSWSVSGGGSLSAASSTTGADGLARTRLTLGSAVVSQRVTAAVAGVQTSAAFAATATGVKASRVAIVGSVSTLTVGDTARLVARATDAAGVILLDRTTVWTSSAPAVAKVSADGLVTAVGAGEARITATADGASAFVEASIAAPVPDAVEAVSGAGSYPARSTVVVVARVRSRGKPLAGATVYWSIAGGGALKQAGTGLTDADGLARYTLGLGTEGRSVGAALYPDFSGVFFKLDITPGPVARIELSSASSSPLTVGATLQFALSITDADGLPILDAPITWASSNPAVASIDATGMATGHSVGTTTISGGIGEKRASRGIFVERRLDLTPPRLTAISISPVAVDITTAPGEVAVTFTVEDESGIRTGSSNFPHFNIRPPDGIVRNFAIPTQISGDEKVATFRAVVYHAVGSPPGVWGIDRLFVEDLRGNQTAIPQATLQAMGFPVSWTVVKHDP